jgi:WD40 repeat protein
MPAEKLVAKGPKDFSPIGVLADGSTLIGRMDGKERRNLFRWNWRSDRSPKFHVRLYGETDSFLYLLEDKATITDRTHFWDLSTGKLRFKSQREAVPFNISPRFIAFLSQDRKSVQIWNYQTGKLHKNMALSTPTLVIALSPDGTMLATEKSGQKLQVDLYDVKSGRLLRQLPLQSNTVMIWGITFSPDSSTLAVSSTYTINLWRIK